MSGFNPGALDLCIESVFFARDELEVRVERTGLLTPDTGRFPTI